MGVWHGPLESTEEDAELLHAGAPRASGLASDPIRLRFNQSVDLDALRSALHLSIDANPSDRRAPRDLRFEVERAHDEPSDVIVRAADLPADAAFHLAIGELRAAEGSLAGKGIALAMRTRGPLRVLSLRCTTSNPEDKEVLASVDAKHARCVESGRLELVLNAPVLPDEFDAAISVEAGHGRPTIGDWEWTPTGEVVVSVYPGDASGKLEFTVEKTLSDDRGMKLERPFKGSVAFVGADLESSPPFVAFGVEGRFGALPANGAIPIWAHEVHDVSVYAVVLDSSAAIARALQKDPPAPAPAGPIAKLGGARSAGGEPSPPIKFSNPQGHEVAAHSIELRKLLGGDVPRRGVLLLVARFTANDAKTESVLVKEANLTDLAVIGRTSHGRAQAWVLDATTGAPIAGATVRAHTGANADVEVVTDAQGRAELALKVTGKPVVLSVSRDDDFTVHKLEVDGGEDPGLAAVVFNDRGVYRPGETVHLKGVVRAIVDSRLTIPTERNAKLLVYEVREPRRLLSSVPVELSEYGTFHATYVIPPDAPLGWRAALVEVAGQRGQGRWATNFAVTEYRPVELAVTASTGGKGYVRGDVARCEAAARYLHGSPLAGLEAEVRWDYAYRLWRPPVSDEFRSFAFGSPDEETASGWGSSSSIVLDRAGALVASRALDMPSLARTAEIACRVHVRDLDGRDGSTSTSDLVHPGGVYVGLDAPDKVAYGEKLAIRVLTVTPAGALTSAAVEVTAAAVSKGRADVPLGTCSVQSAEAPALCTFTVPNDVKEMGRDRTLELRATSKDERGNAVVTVRRVEVVAPSAPVLEPRVFGPTQRALGLYRESSSVAVGEVTQLTVVSPWEEPVLALLSIQREAVIEERLLTLAPHQTSLDLTITQAMAPYVDVTLVAIHGSECLRADLSLSVDASNTDLRVTISPSTMIARPRGEVDFDVTVTAASGAAAPAVEVTLWAADYGSLAVANYRAPEAAWMFSNGRDLQTHSFVTYDSPLRVTDARPRPSPPSVRMGGTSMGDDPPREDFEQTVFFEPSLVTDSAGHVHYRGRFPDQLSSFRVMAFAVARDAHFGSGETSVVTTQPLVARPTMPPVVRVGDEFALPVTVSSPGSTTRTQASVTFTADGLVPLGSTEAEVTLEGAAPANVYFRVRAERAGEYRVRFEAAGADASSDHVALKGDVVAPTSLEEVAVQGEAATPVAELLGDLSTARKDAGELTLRVSRSRLVGLDRGLEELLSYPYASAEQTASRMLPYVVFGELVRALGVELPADPKTAFDDEVARLAGYQNLDGGFAQWATYGESDPWLTAYVVSVLDAAKQRGLTVPEPLLPRASAYLDKFVTKATSSNDPPSATDRAAVALALDVFAIEARDLDAGAAWLEAHLDEAATVETALLLHALALRGGHDAERARLREALAVSARVEGDTLASALALRALLVDSPDHALIEPLARGLVSSGHGGLWRTTRETAWSLLALEAHRLARPEHGASRARVFIGDELALEHTFGDASDLAATLTVPMSRVTSGAKLTFDPQGGTIFYEARLRFARAALPATSEDHGLDVVRTLSVISPGRDKGEIRVGDMVRLDLQIVSPTAQDDVVIEVPLAGALDVPDDTRLELTMGDAAEPFVRREVRDDRILYFAKNLPAGISSTSILVRARFEGSFVLPSAKAELTYAPEVFGLTAVETLKISPGAP
ncbi:MAG: alpha-2-macroglobulin family protein [Polyangiaceae bacterium]